MNLKTKFNNWRWKRTRNGYVFDKLIFNIFFAMIMVFLFYVCWSYNFDFTPQIYVKCAEDNMQPCPNYFYIHDNPIKNAEDRVPMKFKEKCVYDWCKNEYLPIGFEFGRKPTRLFNSAGWITFLLSCIAFVCNHFIHNRNFGDAGL